jgi:hypothetical protein
LKSTALTQEEEAKINAQLSANAQYEYGYKVADDDAQAYMAHEEIRNGQNVEGKYNYVDANGALVTVTYQAGPEGYSETRDVQDGAVEMRNVYGAWDGQYADTVPAGVSSTSGAVSQVSTISATGSSSSARTSSSLTQSDIIANVLAALQPQISGAVQSAISATSSTSGSSFNSAQTTSVTGSRQTSSVVGSRQANSFIGSGQANAVVGSRQTSSVTGQSQGALISSIIGKLQPQISGAVNAALSLSKNTAVEQVGLRPVPVARLRPTTYETRPVVRSNSGLTGIFGTTGENSVRIETPDFTTVY